MSFALNVNIGLNPATNLADGQTCAAYKASRFGSAPTTNTAAPGGGADYGPTASDLVLFATGGVEFTTTTFENFYVSFYDPADTSNSGTYNLYWTAAVSPPVPGGIFLPTAAAVNGMQIVGAFSGSAPVLETIGSDTNIGLSLQPQGAGLIHLLEDSHTHVVDIFLGRSAPPTGGQSVGVDSSDNLYVQTAGTQLWLIGATGVRLGAIGGAMTNTMFAADHSVSDTDVNYAGATSSVTTVAPSLTAQGSDTNIDLTIGTKGTGVINFGYAVTALGGGAAPTLGTIGGSGPAATAQNSWLKIKINGTASYLPVWR